MAPCLDSPVDALVDAIQDKMHGDLEKLVNLWVRLLNHQIGVRFHLCPKEEMGLSEAEIEERSLTVVSKVRNVAKEMVKCDTKNRDKMLRRCQQQRVQIEELVEELAAGGIETKADFATSSSLLDQNKNLSNKQQELELVKERHMVQIR